MSHLQREKPGLRIGILAELTGPYSLEPLVGAATHYIESKGHETLTVCSGNTGDSALRAWEVLARADCDGIIVHSDTLDNNCLAQIKSRRPNVTFSFVDHEQAGEMAARQLLQLGHHKMAIIAGPANRYSTQYRTRGFTDYLKASAPEIKKCRIIHTPTISSEAGAQAMQLLLENDTEVTAVFFHHENLAVGGLQACRTNQRRVPEELSIISCSNNQDTGYIQQGLSVVQQPLAQIGECAAHNLMLTLLAKNEHIPKLRAWPSPVVAMKTSLRDIRPEMQDINAPQPCRLSPRECECLEWAAKGKTSWETSQILGVSESTIIYHLRNATKKLNAANRLHAVTKALKASLINF